MASFARFRYRSPTAGCDLWFGAGVQDDIMTAALQQAGSPAGWRAWRDGNGRVVRLVQALTQIPRGQLHHPRLLPLPAARGRRAVMAWRVIIPRWQTPNTVRYVPWFGSWSACQTVPQQPRHGQQASALSSGPQPVDPLVSPDVTVWTPPPTPASYQSINGDESGLIRAAQGCGMTTIREAEACTNRMETLRLWPGWGREADRWTRRQEFLQK